MKICTLSRWICQVLKYAGINTKMFMSHSVRAASTRKLKHWVYLSAKFSKRVSGPKNQHGKNYIEKKRKIPRNNHLSINIGALNGGRKKLAFGNMRRIIGEIQY